MTLCLKPAGGFNCHSASSFCSLLQAILLKAYARTKSKLIENEIKIIRAEDKTNRFIWSERGWGWEGETLRDGAEVLVMVFFHTGRERERNPRPSVLLFNRRGGDFMKSAL